VATSSPVGGRRRRSASRAIKETHAKVMKRYDEIRRSRRDIPGNIALKMAMKSVKRK
jgi:hypothetical protein